MEGDIEGGERYRVKFVSPLGSGGDLFCKCSYTVYFLFFLFYFDISS